MRLLHPIIVADVMKTLTVHMNPKGANEGCGLLVQMSQKLKPTGVGQGNGVLVQNEPRWQAK